MPLMTESQRPELGFIPTKAHQRFVELAEACITYRYIGICHGRPGVGKTRSAKEFAHWTPMHEIYWANDLVPAEEKRIHDCQGVFYTASVSNTPRTLDTGLSRYIDSLGNAKLVLKGTSMPELAQKKQYSCPLVIVDEADRLTLKSFEHLRDLYDQRGFGLILLGMPGLEKRLSRYPQLYSRVGFVHEFKSLSEEEIRFLFERQSAAFDIPFDTGRFDDAEALAAIIRITRGNFRLIERLCAQIKRIMALNNVKTLTADIVMAARECLVIGHTT